MNLNQRQMAVFMEVGPLADKMKGQGMWKIHFDNYCIYFSLQMYKSLNDIDIKKIM